MKSFEKSLESFRPEMLVVTGFHMLGSQDPTFRLKQLNMVLGLYSRVSGERSVPIHAEVWIFCFLFFDCFVECCEGDLSLSLLIFCFFFF